MLAFDIHDEHGTRHLVHRADPVKKLYQTRGFPADDGLLLFDVIVNGPIGLHFLDLLKAADRALNGGEISQRAPEPALGHKVLTALLGGFPDSLLSLFLGADEEHFATPSHSLAQETAGSVQLVKGLTEINDVNAVASVENERPHLGIPPLGLMPEMNTGIQQFLYANTNHNFSFG